MTKYSDLQKAQADAWKEYDSWRKEDVYCPAFNSCVRFSLLGWRHIIGATGHRKRISSDVYRRLKLLPHAKKIIERSTTIQNITTKNNQKFYALEAVMGISEYGNNQLRKIRVVIVEDRLKNKVFLSVMDKKPKKK